MRHLWFTSFSVGCGVPWGVTKSVDQGSIQPLIICEDSIVPFMLMSSQHPDVEGTHHPWFRDKETGSEISSHLFKITSLNESHGLFHKHPLSAGQLQVLC